MHALKRLRSPLAVGRPCWVQHATLLTRPSREPPFHGAHKAIDGSAVTIANAARSSKDVATLPGPPRVALREGTRARPGAQTGTPGGSTTFVPRSPGIRDGRWTDLDAEAVERAQRDAARLEREYRRHGCGDVILARPIADLESLVRRHGAPAYRARQLRQAVLSGARSLEAVTSLPAQLRTALRDAGVRTGRSSVHAERAAEDGTVKLLLQLADGRVVETVGIPSDDGRRLTACVSSQVGCPMRCTFCATGRGGYARNLLPHEIVDQVLAVDERFGREGPGAPGARARVSHVVFMGMGEPMLNLPSVLGALRSLQEDLGLGARHVTLSTVGVPGALRQLAARRLQATLAVSLHAPTQALREHLVPSARVYPLPDLMDDCRRYFEATKRRISFEYTLIAGVNDGAQRAQQLADLLWSYPGMRCHVNLIPWNVVDETGFERPSNTSVTLFRQTLEARAISVTVRISKGLDAAAACGQLQTMYQKSPMQQFSVPA